MPFWRWLPVQGRSCSWRQRQQQRGSQRPRQGDRGTCAGSIIDSQSCSSLQELAATRVVQIRRRVPVRSRPQMKLQKVQRALAVCVSAAARLRHRLALTRARRSALLQRACSPLLLGRRLVCSSSRQRGVTGMSEHPCAFFCCTRSPSGCKSRTVKEPVSYTHLTLPTKRIV